MKTLMFIREILLVALLLMWCVFIGFLIVRINDPFTIQIALPHEPLKMQVQPLSFAPGNKFPPIQVEGFKEVEVSLALDLSSLHIPDVNLSLPSFPSDLKIHMDGIPDKLDLNLLGIPAVPSTLKLEGIPESTQPSTLKLEGFPESLKLDGQMFLVPTHSMPRCK